MEQESAENPSADKPMPFMQHFIELRSRLLMVIAGFFLAFLFSFHYAAQVYDFLAEPLYEAMLAKGHESPRFIFTGLTEAFFTQIKLSLWLAVFLTFPLFLSQLWKFIAPALYKAERKAFLPFIVATPILFFLGAAMAYYIVFPMAWQFFLGFETMGGGGSGFSIELEAKINEYLSLVMSLILAFGLSFELPVLLVLLNRAGLVEAKTLAKGRRFAIVGILIFAAIVTPPDVLSQILLAVPMYVLYEVAIWVCYFQEKAMRGQESGPEAA